MNRNIILSRILNNAPGVLYEFYFDPKNNRFGFSFVSDNISQLLGLSKEKLLQSFDYTLKHLRSEALDPFYQSIQDSAQKMSLWAWEGELINTARGNIWVRATSQPEKQDDGIITWSGIILDITREKNALEKVRHQQRLLRNAKKLSALGEMAGHLAHEINTPLATLQVSFENINSLISEHPINISKIRAIISRIQFTIERLNGIINSVRAFSKQDRNDEFYQTDLNIIINDALTLCNERALLSNVKLENNQHNQVFVNCKPTQILQVLVNLINNSIDAVSNLQDKWVAIQLEQENDHVYIKVLDSGPPIPEDIAVNMLSPFFTTKAYGKGTGLGLSMALDLAQSNRGQLRYEPQNAHTCFVLSLPKAS